MQVLNIHTRIIDSPKEIVLKSFLTLATKEDEIWPKETWPRMYFPDGLKVGANGGHGPIRYSVLTYHPESPIVFEFQKPSGFNGIHKFEVTAVDSHKTELKHTISMRANLMGSIQWALGVRWLHDALLEDAFDKVENLLTQSKKKTEWNLWVRILRAFLK